jgi:60 kDa SS-A/Ro ribonucleoprotein
MAQINRRVRDLVTNEAGTKVPKIGAEKQLRRLVLANMLFENQFYMDGESSADLIKALVPKTDPKSVQDLAIEARGKFKLRHVPLLLARELARIGKLPHEVLTNIIQRPDEMGEFVAHYWSEKKQPLSNQVKKGLANCFHKFSEHQLAKWNKSSAAVKLRDVLFMTHAKPKTAEEADLFKRIAEDRLKTPDTWEVALSGGADKRETFERLMSEKKLGALAFLRNLRNMTEAGVPEHLIRAYGNELNVSRVLPFRFIVAANIVPQYEDMLESMMFKALQDMPKLSGRTAIVVDVSGSMFGTKISDKSDLGRFSAAAALAIMCKELCESAAIYSFSYNAVRVAPRRGFALGNAISASQQHGGTHLGNSLRTVFANDEYDRVIVFTDEQSYDRPTRPVGGAKGYIINVAAYKNGVNHSDWVSIDGFSEAVFDYICELEKE